MVRSAGFRFLLLALGKGGGRLQVVAKALAKFNISEKYAIDIQAFGAPWGFCSL